MSVCSSGAVISYAHPPQAAPTDGLESQDLPKLPTATERNRGRGERRSASWIPSSRIRRSACAGARTAQVLLRELRAQLHGDPTILKDGLHPSHSESLHESRQCTLRSPAWQRGASGLGPGTLQCDGQEQKLWAFTFTLGYSRRLRVHRPRRNPWPCGGMWNSSTWSPLQVLRTVPISIITAAILDLLHHSRSINIQGESYRLKEAPQGAASRRGDGRGGIFGRRNGEFIRH